MRTSTSVADTVPESVSEEEEAPGWSILPSTISEMESEDEEKDSKAAPAPTIVGEVPCASPPVDEDNERSDRIKIICDPTTTSMNDATKAQGILGDDKFAKGEEILQLAAMMELKIL